MRAEDSLTNLTCWVVTDGRAGMVAPAIGLAERLGISFEEKVIRLALPWRLLPPAFWPGGILGLSSDGDQLSAPYPDLIISCGRHAIGPVTEIRRRSKGSCLAVHIQHPRVPLDRFDLIAAPAHDRLTGENVFITHGSVGRITEDRLQQELDEFQDRFADMPEPVIAVAIGGSNKVYELDAEKAREIGRQLKQMACETGASLLITASRRTGEEATAILRQELSGVPGEFWDGAGENPYFAYLARAEAIIVTGDSVNMVSEACATGKPVQVIHLPSKGPTKFDLFHQDMTNIGATRPFNGSFTKWDYTPLDETGRLADRVRDLLRQHHKFG